jgi:gas vesicle protein
MSDNQNNHSSPLGGYLAAFAIGALAGAVTALLLAPRSGKETRQMIADRGQKFKDDAQKTYEQAKDYIGSAKAKISDAVEAGKEAVSEEMAKHQKRG